jgi:hypothetical protein
MPRRAWAFFLPLILACSTISARADLVISIQSTTVAEGSTGTVNVYLTSTAAEAINTYAFTLQISNNGSDGTQLAFATPGTGYLSDTSLNPAYVFLGDSSAAQAPASPVGLPTETVYPNDTLTGTDSTFSFDPVSLSSGTPYLLASLTVTTATNSSPMIGDSFTISLIPSSGSGSISDNPNTFFDNIDYTGTGDEISATPFTSSTGTVTIVGSAVAVPEPASILSGITALIVLTGVHRVRRGLGCRASKA